MAFEYLNNAYKRLTAFIINTTKTTVSIFTISNKKITLPNIYIKNIIKKYVYFLV